MEYSGRYLIWITQNEKKLSNGIKEIIDVLEQSQNKDICQHNSLSAASLGQQHYDFRKS